MPDIDIDIVIVGAGIIGPTLALLLKKHAKGKKFTITLFEKCPSIQSIGGGLTLWPNGTEVLLNLPCADKIQKLAGALSEDFMVNAQGDLMIKTNRSLLEDIFGSPCMSMSRSELQKILINTLGKENIIFGTSITGVKHNSLNNKVTVYFNNRNPVQTDLVIGADGAFSTIRRSIFPNVKLEYTGYIVLVGICDLPASESVMPRYMIYGEHRQLFIFPVAFQRYMIIAVRPYSQQLGSVKLLTRDKQIKLFEGWSQLADKILFRLRFCLDKPEFASNYYCNETFDTSPLSCLYKSRIALVGDAAHPIGPIAGLNTNLGLQDAKQLAYFLAKSSSIDDALEQYSHTQVARNASLIRFEHDKKNFLLNLSQEALKKFEQRLKSNLSNQEYFSPLIKAIDPTTHGVKQEHIKATSNLAFFPYESAFEKNIIKSNSSETSEQKIICRL